MGLVLMITMVVFGDGTRAKEMDKMGLVWLREAEVGSRV